MLIFGFLFALFQRIFKFLLFAQVLLFTWLAQKLNSTCMLLVLLSDALGLQLEKHVLFIQTLIHFLVNHIHFEVYQLTVVIFLGILQPHSIVMGAYFLLLWKLPHWRRFARLCPLKSAGSFWDTDFTVGTHTSRRHSAACPNVIWSKLIVWLGVLI